VIGFFLRLATITSVYYSFTISCLTYTALGWAIGFYYTTSFCVCTCGWIGLVGEGGAIDYAYFYFWGEGKIGGFAGFCYTLG
jgi:hypothetical protein